MTAKITPMPISERTYSCTACDSAIPKRISKVVIKPITFLEGLFQYTVEIPVCINTACLLERGADRVVHRTIAKPRAY